MDKQRVWSWLFDKWVLGGLPKYTTIWMQPSAGIESGWSHLLIYTRKLVNSEGQGLTQTLKYCLIRDSGRKKTTEGKRECERKSAKWLRTKFYSVSDYHLQWLNRERWDKKTWTWTADLSQEVVVLIPYFSHGESMEVIPVAVFPGNELNTSV